MANGMVYFDANRDRRDTKYLDGRAGVNRLFLRVSAGVGPDVKHRCSLRSCDLICQRSGVRVRLTFHTNTFLGFRFWFFPPALSSQATLSCELTTWLFAENTCQTRQCCATSLTQSNFEQPHDMTRHGVTTPSNGSDQQRLPGFGRTTILSQYGAG